VPLAPGRRPSGRPPRPARCPARPRTSPATRPVAGRYAGPAFAGGELNSRMPGPEKLLADRYRLHALVGSGGMGEVWRATDEVLGRTVAVKVLRPELLAQPGFADRFLTEA